MFTKRHSVTSYLVHGYNMEKVPVSMYLAVVQKNRMGGVHYMQPQKIKTCL